MIQRIQTVLLILAVGLDAAFVFTPLFNEALQDPSRWISSALMAALLLSVALTLVAIFMFRNRSRQIQWVKRSMILQIITIGCGTGVLFTLGGIGTYLWDEVISLGMVLVALILQYGAVHYIKKDEELVRSMDRIR